MGFFDPLRRAVGIATREEVADAYANRKPMMASQDPCDRFGAAFADFLQHLDARQANAQSRIVRNSGIEWPSAPHLRWDAAARIGREYGKELITKRLASLNDAALARAVNAHALGEAVTEMGERTYNPNAKTSIEDVVKDKARDLTHCVHAFLSFGRIAEFNARAQANALLFTPNDLLEGRLAQDVAEFLPGPDGQERGEWLMEAHRTRLAMAQTGLLGAEATVAAAIEARGIVQLRIGAIAAIDRRAAEEAGPSERVKMLEAAKRKIFLLAYGSVHPGTDSRIKDSVLLESPRQAMAPRSRVVPRSEVDAS